MIVKRIEYNVKRMLNVEWETQKNGENKRHQKGAERNRKEQKEQRTKKNVKYENVYLMFDVLKSMEENKFIIWSADLILEKFSWKSFSWYNGFKDFEIPKVSNLKVSNRYLRPNFLDSIVPKAWEFPDQFLSS